ncbi:Fatty acid synthase [Halotydeus destructor]|nr:Fatty acid synthase [Halotydeus destructor]
MLTWDNLDIAIAGISGRFPESDNIDELSDNLFNHVDMVTEDDRRWPKGLYGLPARSGKIKDLSKFDAQFFGIPGKQASAMDPQIRMLLEATYEAICDAGVSPATLRGTRTGVYVGASLAEMAEALVEDLPSVDGYAATGSMRYMFANRISHSFDFKGPSVVMDTACSSSFMALHQAFLGLRTGRCEQAIVGAVNIGLSPMTPYQYHKLNLLAPDGKCKHLDSAANGFVRAEACSVIFLQKKPRAKRIYATVVHANSNTDGYTKEGITFPSFEAQRDLMRETYLEANVNPLDVNYIEAHGTGTKVGDPQETEAIAEVLCKGRDGPLLVGGVKSNLGHAEPAAGLCGLAKVLIAFEKKCIPANMHFVEANPDIGPLVKGIIRPVVENTPYEGGLAAVNSSGIGGANGHVVLKSNDKTPQQSHSLVVHQIPRLVNMCGRTEEAVNHVFDFIERNPDKVTQGFLALINDISKTPASCGMNYRGSMLVKAKQGSTETFARGVLHVAEKRPVWFVFSGFGSQWHAMGKGLMHLDAFVKSINRCAETLRPYGIDLLNSLMNEEDTSPETTVDPFVNVTAVQIALLDVMRALEIEANGFIGHSAGELTCGYADGCLTLEQTIMTAYWRGKCTEEADLPHGQMAAVGLTWEECAKRCPEGVVPACHNAEDSVTISGPFAITNEFVKQLQSENIFAHLVETGGHAYHCPLIWPLASTLSERLSEVLPEPKLRSSRWISTSVAEEQWNTDSCRFASSAYYVNNMVSPVLFNGGMKQLPKNGIFVELAPHILFQSIMKRTLGADIDYVGMMKRDNNEDALDFLLQAIGKLYQLGLNPAIENLYPMVEYPVPQGTQSISSLIKWDHSESWLVTHYPEYFNPSSSSDYVVTVDVSDIEDEYLNDHCIDGRVLYPATGYLMLAWKMLAKAKNTSYDKLAVEFENYLKVVLSSPGVASLPPKNSAFEFEHLIDSISPREEDIILSHKDVYKDLRVRGFDFGPNFRLISEATADGSSAKVKWDGSWVTFADSVIQTTYSARKNRGMILPVRLRSVRCDPRLLEMAVRETPEMKVVADLRVNVILCKGLEIRGLKVNTAPRRVATLAPSIEIHSFIPYHETAVLSRPDVDELTDYVQVCTTVAAQVARSAGKASMADEILGNIKEASEDSVSK